MPKQYVVEWADTAEEDLRNIYYYILEGSPQNALMVYLELIKVGNTLSTFPDAHPIDPYMNHPSSVFRFLPKWNYKIVFFVQENMVSIVRVFSTHQFPSKVNR